MTSLEGLWERWFYQTLSFFVSYDVKILKHKKENLLEQLCVGCGAQLVLVSLSAQHGQGVGVSVAWGAHWGGGHRPGRREGRLGGAQPGGRGAPGRGGAGGCHPRGSGPGGALTAHLKHENMLDSACKNSAIIIRETCNKGTATHKADFENCLCKDCVQHQCPLPSG